MRRWTRRPAGARTWLALALPLALAGCGDDGDDGALPDGGVSPDGGEEPPGETSRIRFIHASTDAPALDVYPAGEDEPVLEDLGYTEVSRYVELAAGSAAFAIRPADTGPESEPIFTTEPIELPEGERTTAIAAGSPGATEEGAFRVLAFREGFADPGFGRAVVRVVHLAPDVPDAAFDVGDDGEVDHELARFESTPAGGIPVPADQPLQLEVLGGEWRAHLTTFTVPALAEGEERFLLVIGRPDAPDPSEERALSLLAVGPEGESVRVLQNPTLQVLHAVPDAPAVDVNAGGELLVWNLDFAELSGALQVPPGELELSLSENGGGPTLGAATTSELEAGERYLVVPSGFATPRGEEPGLRVVTVRDRFDRGGGAELVAVHAIPDAAALDVGTIDGGLLETPLLAEGVEFGAATDPIDVPIGTSSIGVAPTGTRGPQARFELTAAEGQRTFGVFTGALSPRWDEEFPTAIEIDATSFPWSLVEED